MEYPFFVPDFFKFMTSADCSSNELLIPQKFCDMQHNALSGNWILSIRNGYKIDVAYDQQSRKLIGLLDLFTDFQLVGGEILLFEYVDNSNFKLYIVGEDGNEIKYPAIVHSSQTSSPIPVSTNNGGWKFVKFLSLAHPTLDEIVPPRSFLRMYGGQIPEWFTYVLKNHFIFGGHYEFLHRKLSGLSSICQGLRLDNFDRLELLVFTYDGDRIFRLSLFDGRNVEVGLDINVITYGNLRFRIRYPIQFNIEVMPSHMLRYCPGVTIPVEFKRFTNLWKKNDTIWVYKGSLSWEFEIRKSGKGKRTTIHGGWIHFRNALQLNVGDRCFFRWINESYNHFRVEIVKPFLLNS
ncbi:hypothetical protein ACET3Z_000980 [Daucus carota]